VKLDVKSNDQGVACKKSPRVDRAVADQQKKKKRVTNERSAKVYN